MRLRNRPSKKDIILRILIWVSVFLTPVLMIVAVAHMFAHGFVLGYVFITITPLVVLCIAMFLKRKG
ncbi:MAG: hypothetical protein FWB71_05525 [Defluviitaleaceae bacterium]|nr:hypothetical protein [Defluviitaleaceae bacterium]